MKSVAPLFLLSLFALPSFSEIHIGHMVIDPDSVVFSDDCSNTVVDFQREDRTDFLMDFSAEYDITPQKTCRLKLEMQVPNGWKAIVKSEMLLSGFYFERSDITFQYSLGDASKSDYRYFDDFIGNFDIIQVSDEVFSDCGKPITLEAAITIRSLEPGGWIELLSGDVSGSFESNLNYQIGWTPCSD